MLDKEDVFCAWPKQGQLKSHRKTKFPCTFQELTCICATTVLTSLIIFCQRIANLEIAFEFHIEREEDTSSLPFGGRLLNCFPITPRGNISDFSLVENIFGIA